MAIKGLNPNNNLIKQERIVELWYQSLGFIRKIVEQSGTVNLMTNEAFEKSTLVKGSKAYIHELQNKAIPLVFEKPIYLKPNQNLHLVAYGNAHTYDFSNTERDLILGTNEFKADLLDKDPNDETVLFITGNVVGNGWKISDLVKARVINNNIFFKGMGENLNFLAQKIRTAVYYGVKRIYIMDGREEHKAKQKLNVDVLDELVKEKFNDSMLELLVKTLEENGDTSGRKIEIYHVKGVKRVFNILRENENGTKSYYTMSMHTNLKTTSDQLKGNLKAAEKQHAGFADADIICIQGENVWGYIPSRKLVLFTGRGRYKNAIKENTPDNAQDDKASCTLVLGESHYMEIAWTMQTKNPKTYDMERERAKLQDELDYLIESCKNKAVKKHKELATTLYSNSRYEQNYKE